MREGEKWMGREREGGTQMGEGWHSPFLAPWNGYPVEFYRGTLSVSVL